jgi:hypothetical protein
MRRAADCFDTTIAGKLPMAITGHADAFWHEKRRMPTTRAVRPYFIQQAGEFDELISQHEALVRLLQEKMAVANRTAEVESAIGAAYGSADKKNRDAAFGQSYAGH